MENFVYSEQAMLKIVLLSQQIIFPVGSVNEWREYLQNTAANSLVMRAIYEVPQTSTTTHDIHAGAATSPSSGMDELGSPSAFCCWQRTCRLQWKDFLASA